MEDIEYIYKMHQQRKEGFCEHATGSVSKHSPEAVGLIEENGTGGVQLAKTMYCNSPGLEQQGSSWISVWNVFQSTSW